MMVQTYFFKKGIPEHFDPEKGGYLKILGKKSKENRGLRKISMQVSRNRN